jgi:hypothetical protein
VTGAALGRGAAAVGTLCVGVHLAAVVAGGHGAVHGAVLLAMAVLCLSCVRALWRDAGAAAWRASALMYGGMLVVHLLWLGASAGTSQHAEHTATGGTWGAAMTAGLLLAGVQVVLAVTVLAGRRWSAPSAVSPER